MYIYLSYLSSFEAGKDLLGSLNVDYFIELQNLPQRSKWLVSWQVHVTTPISILFF